jgi:hypothetical protein
VGEPIPIQVSPWSPATLHEYYEASGQNLRAVLTVAQQALLETVGLGEELVGLASLRDAALGLAF